MEGFQRIAACEVRIVQLTPDRPLVAGDLAGADGLVVGGGVTPGYHAAIMPVAEAVRTLVSGGVPYCGVSAGAVIAGRLARLGGWKVDGVAVCPEGSGEGLAELTLVEGLGLIAGPVEVHVAQYGNLGRAVALVQAGLASRVIGVDELTTVIVDGGDEQVVGHGRAWFVERNANGSVEVIAQLAAST